MKLDRMGRWAFYLIRKNEAKVHELNYLFWECTTRCNLHCRHCGSDCNISAPDKDMPLEDFLKALDTIPKKEIPPEFTVVLTGGEPLLRPDIQEIGKAIRKRGMGWSMVSNGYFYTQEMHGRLMEAGMGALTISLDGLEPEHDWMRGRAGSYSKAVSAIAIAAREPRINFDVVTCVNKRTINQLGEVYEVLSSLGVKQWRLFTIIPIGRAAKDPDMLLSKDELRQLMEFIKAKRLSRGNSPLNVTFSCEGYVGQEYENVVRRGPFYCHAGINIASVLIDGRICACPNIDRDVFSQGSIYTDNFYEVWNTRFEKFRNKDWARKGKCAQCRKWRDCLGGGMHNWHGSCDSPLTCQML